LGGWARPGLGGRAPTVRRVHEDDDEDRRIERLMEELMAQEEEAEREEAEREEAERELEQAGGKGRMQRGGRGE